MAQAADKKEAEPGKPVVNGDAAAPLETEEAEQPKQTDAEQAAAQLASNVALIERSVKAKETRMGSGRLLRTTAAIRRRLTRAILQDFITKHLPQDSPSRPTLLAVLEQVGEFLHC